jgi:nucleoside-diphosphate-sugar epimerase
MAVPSPIAVTGASGFIGSWIVKLLLDEGATVHATVRSRTDQAKIGHLEAMAQGSPGRLTLFEADLLEPSGYRQAFASCKVVIHVASPFRIQGIKDPAKELLVPAVTGTRNVLETVNSVESVERVVLTSSIAAIHTDAMDHQPNALNESLWNETASLSYQPYAYSKTQAERQAWRMVETQSRWRLVTINPGLVIGPNLSQRVDSTSIDLMLQFVDGRAKSGIPDMRLGVVDVRDVARAHVLAASLPDAQGRHIVSNQVMSFPEIAAILREIYGNRFPVPKSTVPKALMYLVGPLMGFPWRYVRRNIGVSFSIDNTKSRAVLGLTYLPIRQSLTDCVEQLVSMGVIGSVTKT